MELHEQRPGDHYFVREISAAGIRVVETTYTTSLLITPEHLQTGWPVRSIDELTRETLQPVWALDPELVVLGTGHQQRFPAREIQIEFIRRGIGLESMTLDAAARTFNVVASENRRALAALIWPG